MGFPVLQVDQINVDQGKFTVKLAQSWFLADGSKPEGLFIIYGCFLRAREKLTGGEFVNAQKQTGHSDKVWNVPVLASYCTGDGQDDIVVSGVEIGMLDKSGSQGWSFFVLWVFGAKQLSTKRRIYN